VITPGFDVPCTSTLPVYCRGECTRAESHFNLVRFRLGLDRRSRPGGPPPVLHRQARLLTLAGARHVCAEVTGVDTAGRAVLLKAGRPLAIRPLSLGPSAQAGPYPFACIGLRARPPSQPLALSARSPRRVRLATRRSPRTHRDGRRFGTRFWRVRSAWCRRCHGAAGPARRSHRSCRSTSLRVRTKRECRQPRTRAHTSARTRTHARVCTHAYARAKRCVNAHAYTHRQACTHARARAHTPARTHVHTQMRARVSRWRTPSLLQRPNPLHSLVRGARAGHLISCMMPRRQG
jgi:hypothetical protein